MVDALNAAEGQTEAVGSEWLAKAALYEMLSMGLSLPTEKLAEPLAQGEFAAALAEALDACSIELGDAFEECGLAAYEGADAQKLFHALRTEYTRLFATPKRILVSPYAGVWHANKVGVQPVLFVNKESMGVERFMESCGIVRPEGAYEPLDHIGTEFEFLNYLCLQRSGSMDFPEGVHAPENAYETFYDGHISPWVHEFAHALTGQTEEPLYKAMALVVDALPGQAL